MRKEDKVTNIEQLAATLSEYPHFYVVDMTAMDAEKTSAFRRACFEANIKLMVVKNTMFRIALDNVEGVDFSEMYTALKGNSAIMFTETANLPAKVIKDKAVDGIPALKAAYAEEGIYVGAEHMETLKAIKSKDEVIAEIVALLQSPAKNVVSSLTSGGSTLHGLLEAIGEKNA